MCKRLETAIYSNLKIGKRLSHFIEEAILNNKNKAVYVGPSEQTFRNCKEAPS